MERPLSKTQLEAWRLCQRKWGFPYLANIRGSNEFANLGTKVHSQLEGWLRHGEMPNQFLEEGKIALAGLQHLPPRQADGLLVETEVFTITKSAIYHGFADWLEPGEVPTIGDHKSTVDFKWALRPEDLDRDIQANIYARAAMYLTHSEEANARWVYYRTRGAPKSHLVERKLRLPQVQQFFDEVIDPLAEQILDVWEKRPDVKDLEPNFRACNDYGGCPYREQCAPDAKGRFLAMVAHSGLAAKMKAQAEANKNKDKAPTAEPEPDVAASPINPPQTASGGSLKDRLKNLTKAAAPAQPAAQPAKATKNEAPTKPPVQVDDVWKHTAAGAEATVIKITGDAVFMTLPDGSSVESTVGIMQSASSGYVFVRRGGTSGASTSPAPTKAAPAPAKAEKSPSKAEKTVLSSGFVLLAGCFPIQGPPVTAASEIIAKARATVEAEAGVVDYRLVDFNRGAAMLAAALRIQLADEPPDGLVYLDIRTDEGRHAYEPFREAASIVIRSL